MATIRSLDHTKFVSACLSPPTLFPLTLLSTSTPPQAPGIPG